MGLVTLCVAAVTAMLVLAWPGCEQRREAPPPDSPEGWARRQGFSGNPDAVAGARIASVVGCFQCHTYLGTGSSNVGGRDLSKIGRDSSIDFAAYVANPALYGNDVMPTYMGLGPTRLRQIAAFLRASRGER